MTRGTQTLRWQTQRDRWRPGEQNDRSRGCQLPVLNRAALNPGIKTCQPTKGVFTNSVISHSPSPFFSNKPPSSSPPLPPFQGLAGPAAGMLLNETNPFLLINEIE